MGVRIAWWALVALAVLAIAAAYHEPAEPELIPPMICQRGHVPECWTVPE